jgi:signal transduction histidine kinase
MSHELRAPLNVVIGFSHPSPAFERGEVHAGWRVAVSARVERTGEKIISVCDAGVGMTAEEVMAGFNLFL